MARFARLVTTLGFTVSMVSNPWAQAPDLFKPAAAPALAKGAVSDTKGAAADARGVGLEFTRRAGHVSLDWSALVPAPLRRSPDALAPRLSLNLFPDAILVAERTKANWFGADRFDWVGRIGDDPVVLSMRGGGLSGIVQSGSRIFEIEALPGGLHRVVERDQAAYDANEQEHPDGCGAAAEAAPAPEGPVPPTAGPETEIDVMVLYEKAAADKIPNMESYLASLITLSNESYARSRIPQKLRLVHHQLVNSGVKEGENLAYLRNDSAVAKLRNQYGADLVTMLIESYGPCGTASGQASIVKRSCALGNKSFPHELGHNMGAGHDREQASNPQGYAYGYINQEKKWRTIMSYATDCTGGCGRINNFSNPDVLHNGSPTGVADTMDNARRMRERMATVSSYRSPKIPVGILDSPGGAAAEAFAVSRAVPGELGLELARPIEVTVTLVSLSGATRVLARKHFPAGAHRLAWKAGTLARGIHYLRIEGGGFSALRAIPAL